MAMTCMAWSQSGNQETIGEQTWWLHENYFESASPIDILFNFILYMTSIVGVAVFIVLGIFLVKYRHKPNRQAIYTHGNPRLEVIWTIIPTMLMVITAALSQSTWAELKNWPIPGADEPEPIQVRVFAQQFTWNIWYPGKDGEFGDFGPQWRNKDGGPDAQIGINRSDPKGKDDIVSGAVMVVPVNRKVFIELYSLDVLHSFYLPNFRVKQDAVPGLSGQVWVEASKTSAEIVGTGVGPKYAGTGFDERLDLADPNSPKPFDIVCAELCGASHFMMRGRFFVVTQDEYEKWLKKQEMFLGGGDDF